MLRVAVDVGRSGVKAKGDGLDSFYPMSIIRNPEPDPEIKTKIFSFVRGRGPFKGSKDTYLFGQQNSSEAFTLASEGESFIYDVKMLWELYLVALSVKSSGETSVFLGSTFTFNNLSISADYSKELKGSWIVKIGEEIITFEILKVLGGPQGFLSYWANNAGVDPGVVVDFGEYTLDLAFIQNGVLDRLNSTSINIGSREVWGVVKQEIYRETFSDVPITVLETGEDFSYSGVRFKAWNIRKLYSKSLETLYEKRFNMILLQALSGKPVNWILIAGGVSSQLGKLLNGTFPKLKIYVAEDPRMSNVIGLKKMMDGITDEAVVGR